MKKITYILACACMLGFSSCQDTFLDLEPLSQKTDLAYFKTPEHFREYVNECYTQLLGWRSGIFDHMDIQSDLITNPTNQWDLGHGTIIVGYDDGRWTGLYNNIRANNILLERAAAYAGKKTEIQQYVSETYFLRAYNYFYLLKYFGGVPIVTKPLDTSSPELKNPRNSRYEVIDLILSDLNNAINGLPLEQNIPSSDKGRLSRQGAKAFKARVLLYEATWRKNVGDKTDFKGSGKAATDQVNDFLDECITLSKEVMDDPAFKLWNYNSYSEMGNLSSYYLFCIEDDASNPKGLSRDTNKEFIICSVFDREAAPGKTQLNFKLGYVYPSRKLVDMFVCKNGMPITNNDQFGGYHKPSDEFKERDFRLQSYVGIPKDDIVLNGASGYGNRKFITYKPAADREESANYPVLRLAEVYLNYAEAVMTRHGEISDKQLDASINKLRDRAGVAHLTNALITTIKQQTNSAKSDKEIMMDEIRRERTVELYMEGFRFDDLKRWGIAAQELNQSRCGMVLGKAGYATTFRDASGVDLPTYKPLSYTKGEETVKTGYGEELPCVVLSPKSECNFRDANYLYPIPQHQIDLNPNLVQNPGY